MKKLLIILSVFIGILVAAALAVPYFISADTLKKQALSFLEDTTGRSVRIDGELSLSVFPSVGVEVGKLQLSNPAGFDDKTPFISVEHAHISVALLPLLQKDIQFTHFTLDKPLLSLRVNKDGRVNWHFSPRHSSSDADTAKSKSQQAASAESGANPLGALQLSDVTIKNATFTYNDALSGANYQVEDLNATINVSDIHSPIAIKADAVWHNERVNIEAGIDSYDTLVDKGKSANTLFSLNSKHLSFTADGKAALEGFSGDITFKSESIKALMSWVAPKEAPIGVKTALSADIKTSVSCSTTKCDFNKLTAALDKLYVTGNAKADFSQTKPTIEYDLAAGVLDFNPYFAKSTTAGSSMFMSSAYALHPRWDTKPIDLSGLSAINVSGSLSANDVKMGALSIERATIKTLLKSGRLAVNVNDFGIYNGTGNITLAVDANPAAPTVDLRTKFQHVSLQDMLSSTTEISQISGDGTIALNVRTAGGSQAQMVQRLSGSGDFIVANGVYEKTNLIDMFNNVTAAFGAAGGSGESTRFTEAKGTFTIREGVIYNNDLRVAIPGTVVEGEGNVNLPDYTLQYRLTPRSIGSTQNAAGESVARNGTFIPVLISGSLEKPKFTADLKSSLTEAIKDPEAFKDGLKNTRKNLKEQLVKDPKEALKNIKGIFKGL